MRELDAGVNGKTWLSQEELFYAIAWSTSEPPWLFVSQIHISECMARVRAAVTVRIRGKQFWRRYVRQIDGVWLAQPFNLFCEDPRKSLALVLALPCL